MLDTLCEEDVAAYSNWFWKELLRGREAGRGKEEFGLMMYKNWSGSGSVGEAKRKSGIRVKWRTLVHNLQFEDVT